jgi:hypothetical protein
MSEQLYNQIIKLIDDANAEDPNKEIIANKEVPKELIYGQRMTDMILRFAPDADEVQKISVHAQHICRWKSPRKNYPMGKKGYHQWRTSLYTFHARTTAQLMDKAGYDKNSIQRVELAIGKKSIKTNADTQMLENIAALVFIEHYMLAFVEKYPDYDEPKWIDIIRKTWNKMSEDAQQFALSGQVQLPESLIPLIKKSVL